MDKTKIIDSAAKLVAKGAYDKAIKEYQKILDVEPKDVRILQKMGELYQKKNDAAQAATFFVKVAESYSADGFFLKAVALYKQVLKLNPGLVEVNLRLAELHQQLQLMSEAMAYYQLVATHFEKQGDTKSSLNTLKKMLDLDPDSVVSREKLAELYARERMGAQAAAEYLQVADYFKRSGRHDDYLRVAEKLVTLDPSKLEMASELAKVYLSRGDQKRALAKLQLCFKANPRDVETLKLLASAFEAMGQTSKTMSVLKELARVLDEGGKVDDAARAWLEVERLNPADADLAAHRSHPGERRASAQAAPAEAERAAVARPGRPALADEQLAKLLTETDVYVKYGLHDKALEHLRKVFAVDPENLDAHERAYHIYVGAGNQTQAFDQLLNVLRLCTRRAEVERAQPYLATILRDNLLHPEVPAFLAVLKPEEPEAESSEHEGESPADDGVVLEMSEDEVVMASPAEALGEADVIFETGAVELVAEDGALLDSHGSVATPAQPLVLDEGGEAPTQQHAQHRVESAAPEADPAQEECDEASFFLEQGLFSEAREVLDTVLIAYPGHALAVELLARLDAAAAQAAQLAGALELSPADVEVATTASVTDDFQYSVDEVFSEFKKGLEKVVKPEDVDTHYDLGIAYKEMELFDDAIGEFAVARRGCLGTKREIDCLTMMALLLRQKGDVPAAIAAYRQALASEHTVGDMEQAVRYELGATYEASGSPGKALFHFKKVHELDATYRDVARRLAQLSAVAAPEDDSVVSTRPGAPKKRTVG